MTSEDSEWEIELNRELMLQEKKLKENSSTIPRKNTDILDSQSHNKMISSSSTKFINHDETKEHLSQYEIQKKIENDDARLCQELLDGCVNDYNYQYVEPITNNKAVLSTSKHLFDSLNEVPFKRSVDISKVARILADKIEKTPAKSPIILNFISELLIRCVKKMNAQDLVVLQNKLKNLILSSTSSRAINAMSKRKVNDDQNSLRYIQNEIADYNDPFSESDSASKSEDSGEIYSDGSEDGFL